MSEQLKFTDEEQALLKQIARAIIPPASADGLPGANDEIIFKRLLSNAADHVDILQGDLHELLSDEGGISTFANSDKAKVDEWITGWAAAWPDRTHAFFNRFVPMLLRAYYQDSRVHSAYDRRPGPPFPEGYVIIDGDWSLLAPVRDRKPIYRIANLHLQEKDG